MRLPGLEKPDTLIDFVPDMVQKQQKNRVIAQTIPEPGSNSNSVGDVAGGCSRSLVSLPHEVLRIILAQASDPYDLAVFTCAASLIDFLALSKSTWKDEVLHLASVSRLCCQGAGFMAKISEMGLLHY